MKKLNPNWTPLLLIYSLGFAVIAATYIAEAVYSQDLKYRGVENWHNSDGTTSVRPRVDWPQTLDGYLKQHDANKETWRATLLFPEPHEFDVACDRLMESLKNGDLASLKKRIAVDLFVDRVKPLSVYEGESRGIEREYHNESVFSLQRRNQKSQTWDTVYRRGFRGHHAVDEALSEGCIRAIWHCDQVSEELAQ